jgi:hypothetical protein
MAIAAASMVGASALRAQTTPQNYGTYYNRHAVQGTRTNVDAYLYDKYFYRQPAVSPYVNLSRRGGISGNAYSTYVLPELQRRQQSEASMRSYVQQRKIAGNVGRTNYSNAVARTSSLAPLPSPAPIPPSAPAGNPYFNQWYGGRR